MARDPTRRAFAAGVAGWTAAGAALAAAPMAEETGKVPVPGGQVWYRRVGGGGGAPLLVLHGGPGAGSDYLFSLAALGDERPVIFYDQLGCGRSDIPSDVSLWTIGRFCDEVDAVRRALGLGTVALFGHSWGGWLAQEYLATRSEPKVCALVLASTSASAAAFARGAAGLVDAMPEGARLKTLVAEGRLQDPDYERLAGEFMLRHVFGTTRPDPGIEAAGRNLATTPVYPVMNGPNEFTITGNLKDWDRTAALARIRIPTLITRGGADEASADCAEALRRGIRGSRLVTFPHSAHLATVTEPEAYVAALRRFLRSATHGPIPRNHA